MNTQPIKLCARTDIPEGEMIETSVPGTDNSLLLVSTKGAIRAFQNKCPHMDIPLCQGAFDGEVITCTEHLWQFDAQTGAGIEPEDAKLQQYPVSVIGDEVFVELPEAAE